MNIAMRWACDIPHDPRSEQIAQALARIDTENGDYFNFKFGGDGDNGEELMYLLDIFFDEQGTVAENTD